LKPTLSIAILRSPNHGARRLLKTLTGVSAWSASYQTEARSYELTVGMPPSPEVHGVIVLVDASIGVTLLLRRALWHAKRRGVRHFVGLLLGEASELFDLAALELRECLQATQLEGDSLSIIYSSLEALSDKSHHAALFDKLEEIPFFALKKPTLRPDEKQILQSLKTLGLRRTGSERIFSEKRWKTLRRGEAWAATSDQWRLHSILHQAVNGSFDDLPDLLTIAKDAYDTPNWPYYYVPFDLLGFLGTWELVPLLTTALTTESRPFTEGELICSGMSYWCYLSCVPILLEEFDANRSSDVLFIYPWAIRRILAGEEEEVLDSDWERYVPEEDMAAYHREANLRLKSLTERLQSRYALSLHAEPFSVRRVAEFLVRCRERKGFDAHLSQLFVAQTGLSPDAASLKTFLANEADRYQEGVRYFFGKPIPDFSREVADEVQSALLGRYQR
jgi:hypothetical protein